MLELRDRLEARGGQGVRFAGAARDARTRQSLPPAAAPVAGMKSQAVLSEGAGHAGRVRRGEGARSTDVGRVGEAARGRPRAPRRDSADGGRCRGSSNGRSVMASSLGSRRVSGFVDPRNRVSCNGAPVSLPYAAARRALGSRLAARLRRSRRTARSGSKGLLSGRLARRSAVSRSPRTRLAESPLRTIDAPGILPAAQAISRR